MFEGITEHEGRKTELPDAIYFCYKIAVFLSFFFFFFFFFVVVLFCFFLTVSF